MEFKKDISYRDVPFSCETPREDFFYYDTASGLHDWCENNKDNIIKVRTVGILKNKNGCFYIKQMTTKHSSSKPADPRHSIQISMTYMNNSVRYSGMAYPVQLFGRMQWCDRPVIFAQIIQPLSVPMATLLHETLTRVLTLHSSRHFVNNNEFDN